MRALYAAPVPPPLTEAEKTRLEADRERLARAAGAGEGEIAMRGPDAPAAQSEYLAPAAQCRGRPACS
jgi:hypothetical protein